MLSGGRRPVMAAPLRYCASVDSGEWKHSVSLLGRSSRRVGWSRQRPRVSQERKKAKKDNGVGGESWRVEEERPSGGGVICAVCGRWTF